MEQSIHIGGYVKLLNASIIVVLACVLLVFPFIGIANTLLFDQLIVASPGLISTASLILFVILCVLALTNDKIYFLILPFILLAFPAAVNDFFPSIYLGSEYEYGAAAFPFFTHIDIFLFLGLLRKFSEIRISRLHVPTIVIVVVCLFFLSSLVNLIMSDDAHRTGLLIHGLYPLRYFILLLIIISSTDIERFEKQIIYSLIFSILFLIVEASINSKINHTEVMASGSLGSNTFANIVSGILVFFIYLKRNGYKKFNFFFIPVLVSCVLIILLTETRIAIVAGVASYLLIQVYHYKFYRSLIVIVATFLLAIIVYSNIEVPDRYSIAKLSSKIKFNQLSWNPSEMFEVERSHETSSIYSRLKLYDAAFKMIEENPFLGTGYGTFNYVKHEYGFDEQILIDAHNGYLNTLAQLGLSGFFFIYFFYFKPFFSLKRIKTQSFLRFLFIINITMAIADLTNAGIYKHSVFAILAFNAVIILILEKQSKTRLITYSAAEASKKT